MNNQKDSSPRRGRMSDKLRKRLKDALKPLLQYVSTHEELDLQLRDNYFNVYYNGGNALRVTSTGLFLDPWYFYTGEYNGIKIPKTYIEEQCKNKPRHRQPRNYPSKELAQEIYGLMKSKAATILEKAEKGDFKTYFEELKPVMDNWVTMYNREERKRQHIISCSNRDFTPDNNLVVIDIEFAVSKNKLYNHAVNENGNPKVPKMDIIAVDKDGQLFSIELKNNLEADAEDSAQNVENHLKDFDMTLGWPKENDFAQEMSEVVKMKQELGILGNEVFVDTTHLPLFAIAYAGDIPEESAKFKHRHNNLTMVDLTKKENGTKIYLEISKSKRFDDLIAKMPGEPKRRYLSSWTGCLNPNSEAYNPSLAGSLSQGFEYRHTSGHCDMASLESLIEMLSPQSVIPIHTDNAEAFAENLSDRCPVILLKDGESINPIGGKYIDGTDAEIIAVNKPTDEYKVIANDGGCKWWSLDNRHVGYFGKWNDATNMLQAISYAPKRLLGYNIEDEEDMSPFSVVVYDHNFNQITEYEWESHAPGEGNFQEMDWLKPGDKVLAVIRDFDAVIPCEIIGPISEEFLKAEKEADEMCPFTYDELKEEMWDWDWDKVIVRPLVRLADEYTSMPEQMLVQRVDIFPYREFDL